MKFNFNSHLVLTGLGLAFIASMVISPAGFAQTKKKKGKAPAPSAVVAKDSVARPPKAGPKAFSAVITPKAVADSGLFNVYKQDDKFFFEIADSLLGRDILVVSRIAKSGADLRAQMLGYSGDIINESVIRFEKGPNNKLFLRTVAFNERSDSTQAMYRSVMNSNIQPIVAAFDIKAFSKTSKGSIIDFTDYISGDNDVLFFDQGAKSQLKLGSVQADRSYISGVQSFPINTEIKTVKTYVKSGAPAGPGMPPAGGGYATLELNASMVLLPRTPMKARHSDSRVGYFTTNTTDFDLNPQGVKKISMITRWRLEPKAEDMEKYMRGELVEPKKPIVFYIDPTTPEKWRKYLIQGVNDWQSAFEQAGFKNAIIAKMPPTKAEDPTWSLEDARFSAIVYKPSDVANASGPHVHDPRSGEILESHINWYHNVMKLLRNWYIIQAAPNDERARTMQFSDKLMGDLIRFVSSHEVGHTLGLKHNFGSSSAYPVEKLRDKEWVKKNGHAASIMDYARFNYVAQPGDGITGADLYPRINFYDKWAIEWGYKLIPEAKSSEKEAAILNKWVLAKAGDKRYWFGHEKSSNDPRSQSEDLGDDAMKAGAYGIKNLQYILPKLMSWSKEPNEGYTNLAELYEETVGQYNRYIGHVVKNVGGIYETPKTTEQSGAVYELVPKEKQQRAVAFLNQQLFTTPTWLLDYSILNRIGSDGIITVRNSQLTVLERLMGVYTINKLISAEAMAGSKAYTAANLFNQLKGGIWAEIYNHKPITVYRRNLQKIYVENLKKLMIPEAPASANMQRMFSSTDTDASSIARVQLVNLSRDIRAALPSTKDTMSRYHLQDLTNRIAEMLKRD